MIYAGQDVKPVRKGMKMDDKTKLLLCRAVSTIAVCMMGAVSMWASDGKTGIGWAILALMIIW
jgi:hypothetical protein